MNALLRLSGWIDRLNGKIGLVADWLVLAACIISAGNALVRYAFSIELERLARDPVVHVRRRWSCSAPPTR